MAINQNWSEYDVEIGWKEVDATEVLHGTVLQQLLEESIGEERRVLSSNDYDVTIDDTVTITLKVVSILNKPISYKSVSVNCSDGNFYNGNGITTSNNYKTATGTTNSEGIVTFRWNATETGLISISSDEESIQIYVRPYYVYGQLHM